MSEEGIDAYFGVRRENIRYLTGFELGEGEEKVAGNSGQFLVGRDEVVVLADSRYTVAAVAQCTESRIERIYNDLFARWPTLLADLGSVKRVAVESGFVSYAMWQRLAAAAPDVELVAVEGWVEDQRQTKEPAEVERVAAACAVADAALTRLLPKIRPGVTEAELAIDLEWEMRTNGAEALAFDVACLSGPNAALPHGAPSSRELKAGEVVLFDFGAQVAGYRSDMTRTLFVGRADFREPGHLRTGRPLAAVRDRGAGARAGGGDAPERQAGGHGRPRRDPRGRPRRPLRPRAGSRNRLGDA